MLLYYFTSVRIGEVYELTVQRRSARLRNKEDSDKILQAWTIAAYYKVSLSNPKNKKTGEHGQMYPI